MCVMDVLNFSNFGVKFIHFFPLVSAASTISGQVRKSCDHKQGIVWSSHVTRVVVALKPICPPRPFSSCMAVKSWASCTVDVPVEFLMSGRLMKGWLPPLATQWFLFCLLNLRPVACWKASLGAYKSNKDIWHCTSLPNWVLYPGGIIRIFVFPQRFGVFHTLKDAPMSPPTTELWVV